MKILIAILLIYGITITAVHVKFINLVESQDSFYLGKKGVYSCQKHDIHTYSIEINIED